MSDGLEMGGGRHRLLRGLDALLGVGRRSERAVAVAVGVMLLAVAAVVTAAPRALQRAETSSLDRAIADAPEVQRRLAVRAVEVFGRGRVADPVAAYRELLDEAAELVPDVVADRYGPARILIDSNRFTVATVNDVVPASPTFLNFRVQPDLDAHSRIVEGRAAQPVPEPDDDRGVIEFELSTVAADVMGFGVGDTFVLGVDTNDAVTRRYAGGFPPSFVGRLVGLRDLDEASDPFWFGDSRLHRPTVADTGVGANFFVHASIPADALPTRPFMVDGRSPFFVEQRRDLIPSSIDLANADEVLDGLVELDAAAGTLPAAGRPGIVAGLRRVLDGEQEQRQVARSTLALAGVGVLGVAFATLAQSLQVAFARRRGWLSVARARGASDRQVVLATMSEVAVVSLVVIVVGTVAARAALGGSGSDVERRLLVGLWIGSVATAGLLATAEVRRPIDASGRAGAVARLGTWGRAAGAGLVAIAAGALVTFLRRGLDAGANEADGLVVLVPVLVPLAFVFLTRWVLPLVLGTATRIGMRFGPGRLIGLRRATADPGAGAGLIAVLTLALTVAGLGLGINRSLERGIVDASWSEVGAPFRIESSDPDVQSAVAGIPGIEVAEYGDNNFRLDRDGSTFAIRLINIETAAIDALVGGTAADENVPEELRVLDAAGRVPVIASRRIGGAPVRPGDTFAGTGSLERVEFVVEQTRTEAFGREGDWIVADRAVYELAAERTAPTTTLLFDLPPDGRTAIDALVVANDLELEDRGAVEAQQRDDPLVLAVRWGYLAAGAVAILLALMAVVGLAVVTARQRRREISVLGLLGAGRREIGRAVRSELVPPVVAGVVLGTALGWLMVTAFDGRFDLSSFAAGTPVALRPDLAFQLVGGAITAGAAIAIVAVLVRRIVSVRVNEVLRVDGAA